jgi:hypothetical protein
MNARNVENLIQKNNFLPFPADRPVLEIPCHRAAARPGAFPELPEKAAGRCEVLGENEKIEAKS